MGPKLYSQDELEEIFRRRMREQEDLIGKVADRAVEKLRTEFEGINTRIDSLTEQVKETNGQVSQHSRLLDELGVAELSQTERAALPEVLVEHVQSKGERKQLERRNDRLLTLWLVVATAGGSLAGAVLAAIAVVAYLSQIHITGAH